MTAQEVPDVPGAATERANNQLCSRVAQKVMCFNFAAEINN